MSRILIKNGFVITLDKRRTILPGGIIEIENDRIIYVGSEKGRIGSRTPTTIIDATRKVVMPGLVNGHTHLCMTFGRTIGYELNVMDWINQNQYPLMDEMGEREYYLASMIGCIENLKNGNTTVVDNICSSHKKGRGAEKPSLEAVRRIGLRSFSALSYADQNYYPNAVEKGQNIVARCRELLQQYHNTEQGKLRMLIGPVVPWACSKKMFEETIRLSEEFNIGLHIHASENVNWNTRGAEIHGLPTNIAIYKKYGCLGPKTGIAAMRIFSDSDITDLAETGTGLILDPTPALNWGTGLPPIAKIIRSGILFGLGTNGASSNFGQDMFESMKNAIGIARTASGEPGALPLNEALEMATIRNAEILGLSDQVGSLEVGKKADVITVNLGRPHQSPCLNVIADTVLSSRGSDVEEVIVDGKILLEKGKFVDFDETGLLEEACERAVFCAKKAHLDDRLLPLVEPGQMKAIRWRKG